VAAGWAGAGLRAGPAGMRRNCGRGHLVVTAEARRILEAAPGRDHSASTLARRMRIRHGLAPAAVALALAVPSAAHAQGAGDDQYTDPFGSDQATPTATPRATAQATATPAPAAPAPAQSSTAATATPVPAQAPVSSSGPTLPYTGVDAWIPGLSGALLLGAGLALRVRLREHD
jgi:hypothetical protein